MKKMYWTLLIGLFAPLFANAADLRIPPQALGRTLQELAKQSGIQIMFFSNLVEGHDAPALNGTFTTEAALAALLDGTNLTYRVLNDKVIEIAARPIADAPLAALEQSTPGAPLDEVAVNARHEKLSVISKEIDKLEEQFYAEYNKVNNDPQYQIDCSNESHTLWEMRVCQPVYVRKALQAQAVIFATGGSYGAEAAGQATMTILLKTSDYQKNMLEVVKRHPQLLKLLKERSALVQRYGVVRKEKFKGKTFVWD
jgi:hypothetical protein